MRDVRLSFASTLSASPETVWAWATTPYGVNEELAAAGLQMDFPEHITSFDGGGELGQPVASIPLLLFGMIPVDTSELTFVEWGPGPRFVEQSPMRGFSLWEHIRQVRPDPQGCIVTDDLRFVPRRLRRPTTAFVERLFAMRHGRLQREWPL